MATINRKINSTASVRIIAAASVAVLAVAFGSVVVAQSVNVNDTAPVNENANLNANTNTAVTTPSSDPELDQLNQQIDAKQQQVDELKRQAALYEQQLRTKKTQSATLKGELNDLTDSIDSTQNQLETNKAQIETLQLQIQKVQKEIAGKEAEIATYRDSLATLLRQLYVTDQVSNLEILVEEQTFSGFFSRVQSLTAISGSVDETLQNVLTVKKQLDESRVDLDGKRQQLDETRVQLEESQQLLSSQQSYKLDLLTMTQDSQEKYEQLMQTVSAEATALDAEIESLVQQAGAGGTTRPSQLSWPVDPSRGISAYFHDPTYPWGVHTAIDVRVYQGTIIQAAADGVVQRAEHPDWKYAAKLASGKCPSLYFDYGDSKTCRRPDYNYVVINHGGGIATEYLHLSQVNVVVGQTVKRGDTIGRSGGTPNTAGAGLQTTGPHLHFVVFVNGIPDDPLKYLPAIE